MGNLVKAGRRALRIKQVQERVPYSRASIYRKMAAGQFPKSFALGDNAAAWDADEIDQWLASRMATRGASLSSPKTTT